jgi:hypothetical protein
MWVYVRALNPEKEISERDRDVSSGVPLLRLRSVA